jgi:hypothetical protein
LVRYTPRAEKALKIFNLKKDQTGISFDYKFKTKGTYDTHLKVNGHIEASYTIKVSRIE